MLSQRPTWPSSGGSEHANSASQSSSASFDDAGLSMATGRNSDASHLLAQPGHVSLTQLSGERQLFIVYIGSDS